jgi:hypothetical protein
MSGQFKSGGSSKSLNDETASVNSSSKQESLSPEQKSLMWKTRFFAVFLTAIFIVISLYESARVILCIGNEQCFDLPKPRPKEMHFTKMHFIKFDSSLIYNVIAAQLLTIAFLACIWDEGAWLARSDEGTIARARAIGCQMFVVVFPAILAGEQQKQFLVILSSREL